ncbi:YfaZ family outer membrane protein [Chromobacterium amazonense]|uniref:YfaZ family outer membrane protein n=1 Tax=Chromobacterium amazonense TaxID=1382803 RepID=A0ABU8V7A8_9NEIS|nr:YfaZ family outer membrane protein [Chromobacterium amazonense]MDQ4540072.1 YfaZ family outer membrane protein [Chromobacterium amazonense]
MKHFALALALALAGLAGGAHAADYIAGFGNGTQQFQRTPDGFGIGLNLDYLRDDHKGSAGGAGLEFALPLGPLTVAAGGKLMALSPDSGSATATLIGGRASFNVSPKIKLFGQAYYAPSSFASGSVNRVNDYAAGVRWNAFGPLSVEAGYRYFDIRRDDDSRSRRLADGVYLGAGLSF